MYFLILRSALGNYISSETKNQRDPEDILRQINLAIKGSVQYLYTETLQIMSNVPSKTTKLTTIRLKNEDVHALDKMAELIGKNRSDTIRILLMPSIIQAKVAMETKSVMKAAKARITAEIEQGKMIADLAKNAEVQGELNLVEFGQFSVQTA